jgi:hypothetical protein
MSSEFGRASCKLASAEVFPDPLAVERPIL